MVPKAHTVPKVYQHDINHIWNHQYSQMRTL